MQFNPTVFNVLARRLFAPPIAFLGLSWVFGTVFIALTPPSQAPDENTHFWRAYQISEGTLVAERISDSTGGSLPTGVLNAAQAFGYLSGHPEQKVREPLITLRQVNSSCRIVDKDRAVAQFPNTAAYPPLPYVPQAGAMAVVRLFSDSALACLYAARLVNLLAATAILSLAIGTTPVLKWTFVLLGLTPMALFLMASASPDALTNAVCFLYAATVFRLSVTGGVTLSLWVQVKLLALAAALSLMKPGYYPLTALCVMIPAERWGGRRRYWLGVGLVFLVTTVALGSWALIVREIYSPIAPYVKPREQLRYMIGHPGDFAMVLARTAFAPSFLWRHAVQYVGALGWLDAPLPAPAVSVHLAALALAAMIEVVPAQVLIEPWQRVVAVAVGMLNWVAIAVTGYMGWMSVGREYVLLQGRYFIPLGPVLCFALCKLLQRYPNCRTARGVIPGLVPLYAITILVVAVRTLLLRYYLW